MVFVVRLDFFYIIIDVRSMWSGTPLVHAGMNAIVMLDTKFLFHLTLVDLSYRIDEYTFRFIIGKYVECVAVGRYLLLSILQEDLYLCLN